MEEAQESSPQQATVDPTLPNRVNIPMNQQPDPLDTEAAAQLETPPEQQQPEQAPEKTEDDAAKEVADAAGLDYEAIASEFQTAGEISPETRAKIVEAVSSLGLSEKVVDNYFAGLNARSELITLKAYQITGGEENYQAMAEWAQTSLSDAERKVYSELVAAGGEEQALAQVSMLYKQFKSSRGLGGNKVKASSGSASSGPLFHSQKELAEAFADPRVAKSPRLQKEVRERLKRSLDAGVYKQ